MITVIQLKSLTRKGPRAGLYIGQILLYIRKANKGVGISIPWLFQAAESLIPPGFKGSKIGHSDNVKLDQEARRLVERLTGAAIPAA
jgi:hypothetical protein